MCVGFYLLKKKKFISLTTAWVLVHNLFFLFPAPLGPVSHFHKPEVKLQGHINVKVSFAHIGLFSEFKKAIVYNMDSCQGLVAVTSLTGFQIPPVLRNCKHGNGLVYFFVFLFFKFFKMHDGSVE